MGYRTVKWIRFMVSGVRLAGVGGLLFGGIVSPSAHAQRPGTVWTVAGGFLGDGGPAVRASLTRPSDVAVDPQGNLYIADRNSLRIRRVSPDGMITTVAGNGRASFSGDSGPATQAGLSSPKGIAVDGSGNLYIADHHRIRRVSSKGIITTVAGTGQPGLSGDGGPARQAQLNDPNGLHADAAGNLYIADTYNHRIRKIGPDGKISTVAGSGAVGRYEGGFSGDGAAATDARLNLPHDVALDDSGAFSIADSGNHRIRKVGAEGNISTVAGSEGRGYSGDGSLATQAQLNDPRSIAFGPLGSLYIAEYLNRRIRKVERDGQIQTVAGTGSVDSPQEDGPALQVRLRNPSGVAVDPAGYLYIAEFTGDRVRKLGADGILTTVAGGDIGDGRNALQASLEYPEGVALDRSGQLFIADSRAHRIRKVDGNGVITTVAGVGPMEVTEPNHGSPVGGDWSGDGLPAAQSSISSPVAVTIDSEGRPVILESTRLRRIDGEGKLRTLAGLPPPDREPYPSIALYTPLYSPHDVVADGSGNFYVSEWNGHRVKKITPDGKYTIYAGTSAPGFSGDGGPADQAQLSGPTGLAMDLAGNLYLSDTKNHRVRKVTPEGTISTYAGTGVSGYSGDGGQATRAQLAHPMDLAVDSVGNLFISESLNWRVRKISPNGVISTVAGTGSYGHPDVPGEGENATQIGIITQGITVDTGGHLIVGDVGRRRVRKIIGIAGPGIVAGQAFPASGDVDRNGKVEVADAVATLMGITGRRKLTVEQQAFADLNADGSVHIYDVVLILRNVIER